MDPAARGIYARAEEQEAAGRFATAASFYRLVLGNDPAFVPALLGLGRALEAQGDLVGAEALYRGAPGDPDVIEALATLLEATRPAEALSAWREVEVVRLGDPTPYLHQARLLVRLGALEEAGARWATYLSFLQAAEPDGPTLLALVDAAPAQAEPLLREYLTAFPEGAAAAPARERLDRLELEAAAALIDLGADEPLSPELVALATRVEAALAGGELASAQALGAELAARAPSSSVAHGHYADALLAAGAWAEAEVQASIARRLSPDDAGTRARLGRLLADGYGGRRDEEALVELLAAFRLRTGDAALRFRLASVQQSTGRFEAARASYAAVVAAEPEGEWAREAEAKLAALGRAPPELPAAAVQVAPPVSQAAARHWRIARALHDRGRRPEALVELELALVEEPTSPRLLNDRAAFAIEDDLPEEAVGWWKRSLEVEPNQPDLWVNLAREAGDRDERRRCLSRAAELGDADAHYLLARLAHDLGDWGTTEAELEAYAAMASPRSAYQQAAAVMAGEAAARRRGLWGLTTAVLVALLGIPAAWVWRRRSGRTLAELLAAVPESWNEAARLLAAIRHEVLKHNTTVLPVVADALAAGDARPWEALAARLPELTDKLGAYVDALAALGHGRGVRLAPYRDPTLGPLLRAFSRLGRLRHPDPVELRALSRIVNEEVYGELGRLVREICVLTVDEPLVREVYERVAAEPGFAGTALPELWVTGPPLQLRLFRPDLEDILANLLRNALSAGATTLAVALVETEDEVTGHVLAEVAVVDDAPGALTNAMIRSRFIGRGLGLAVDLTNRHGGSIRVDAAAEGAKAVVVQFQVVEGGE